MIVFRDVRFQRVLVAVHGYWTFTYLWFIRPAVCRWPGTWIRSNEESSNDSAVAGSSSRVDVGGLNDLDPPLAVKALLEIGPLSALGVAGVPICGWNGPESGSPRTPSGRSAKPAMRDRHV